MADLEKVICAYQDRDSDACQLTCRAAGGGRLSELLERAARGRLTDRAIRCQFH